MKKNSNRIKGLLTKFKGFEVSSGVNRKILSIVSNERFEFDYDKQTSFFRLLLHSIMDLLKNYAVAIVAFILVILGITYFNQNSYSFHLNKAQYALNKLEANIQELVEYDADFELKILNLTEQVFNETEAAIESAEKIYDSVEFKGALGKIYELQVNESVVFESVSDIIGVNDNTERFLEIWDSTYSEQELIKKALIFVDNEIKGGETEVNIDIETSLD